MSVSNRGHSEWSKRMSMAAFSDPCGMSERLTAALRRVLPDTKPDIELHHRTGLSPSMSKKILSGERLPSLEGLRRIAVAFGPQIVAETLCPEAEWTEQAKVDAQLSDMTRRLADLHREMEALCP